MSSTHVPVRLLHADDQAVPGDPGVVDQHIDPAGFIRARSSKKRCQRPRRRRHPRSRSGSDAARCRHHLFGFRGGGRFALRISRVEVVKENVNAGRRQLPADGPPDPSGAAGYDYSFASA